MTWILGGSTNDNKYQSVTNIFYRLLIVCLLTMLASCTSVQRVRSWKEIVESWDEYNTYRTIELDTIYQYGERYIEYENMDAIILFDIKDFFNYASYQLNDSLLCFPKKQHLEKLMDTINRYSSNLYFIPSMAAYSWIYDKTYPPYGYEIKLDTLNKKRLERLKGWIISDLCLNGKCLVFDKRFNKFVGKIFYLITDFKDGHGGEGLIFEDKKYFHIVEVYTDVIWPDFDCMTDDEIKDYRKQKK